MKIRSNKDYTNGHKWFAWYPVLAEQKTSHGIVYVWVWLEVVERKIVRQAGLAVKSYIVKQ